MKKGLLALCSFLSILSTTGLSSATVIGSGTFSLTGVEEYSVSYNYSGGYFASIGGTQIFLNNGVGSGTLNGSSVSGSHNSDTGAEGFSFTAVNPNNISVNFYSTMYFTGLLDEFGYTYSFNGKKDNSNDYLGFVIQMEISGYFPDYDESTYDWKSVYSDYGIYGMVYDTENEKTENFRTNWVYQQVTDVGVPNNISGTNTFDYSVFGVQEWQIRWDFMSGGYDSTQQTDPVPEPTTMLLFGTGLAGLAAARRRKKVG